MVKVKVEIELLGRKHDITYSDAKVLYTELKELFESGSVIENKQPTVKHEKEIDTSDATITNPFGARGFPPPPPTLNNDSSIDTNRIKAEQALIAAKEKALIRAKAAAIQEKAEPSSCNDSGGCCS